MCCHHHHHHSLYKSPSNLFTINIVLFVIGQLVRKKEKWKCKTYVSKKYKNHGRSNTEWQRHGMRETTKQNTVFDSKNTSWKEKIFITMPKDLNIARRWRTRNTTTFRGKTRKMTSVGNRRIRIKPATFVFPRRQTALAKSNSFDGYEVRSEESSFGIQFHVDSWRPPNMCHGSYWIPNDGWCPLLVWCRQPHLNTLSNTFWASVEPSLLSSYRPPRP